MLSYFYAWTPLVIVGTLVLLAAPWLGVIALLVLALAALAAFALAFVYVPYVVVRAVGRHVHRRGEASLRTAPVLSSATNPGVLGDDLGIAVSTEASAATSWISPTRAPVGRSLRLRTPSSSFRSPRGLRGAASVATRWPTRSHISLEGS